MGELTAVDQEPPSGEPVGQALDSFSYFAEVESKIRGLGGVQPRPDLNYAFHTHYVSTQSGRCTFSIELEGLTATHGILYLQVNVVAAAPDSKAHLVVVDRVPFVDIIAAGSRASIRFQSIPGYLYALFGKIVEDTDAAATALTVRIDRPADMVEEAVKPDESEVLGQGRPARQADHLSSRDRPVFEHPMSQSFTSDQLQDSAFVGWQAQFSGGARDPLKDWRDAFVLQTRATYGPREGKVLGIIGQDSYVPGLLAMEGFDVGVIDGAGGETGHLRERIARPANASDALLEARITVNETLADGNICDFIWAQDIVGGLCKADTIGDFTVDILRRLKLGGIFVHVFDMVQAWDAADPGRDSSKDRAALMPPEIERLALDLVSLGHATAQIRFALDDRKVARRRPFAMIVRRSR